ncbi:Estradiol 17-beta-dehydrogenase 12-B [Fasciola gigantica]|uniref:Estradiol 17-beta-dehydrogenase 12-B n=1 Tax=Fasciola gigantica TaxID=46835 RepID=A0A504YPT7_FASGI|nr:Estradiol 17-beta-dehydrogenase 12-B [Fasciola gigantica]
MLLELTAAVILCKLLFPLARFLFVYTVGKKFFSSRKQLRNAGEWAIVTGASAGIGKAYASELAKDGLKLFLLGNQEQELSDTARELAEKFGVETKIMVVDFTRNDIYEEIETAVKSLSSIACLVNNVGLFYPQSLEPWPESSMVSFEFVRRIAWCNMVSTATMTRIVLPKMLVQHSPGSAIINLSSVSAFFPMPYFSLYASTKAFILAFSEALRNELLDTSIVIQAVCPSVVATGMTQVKPTRSVPSPETFAQSALDLLGVESVTSGYIYHVFKHMILTNASVNVIKKRTLAAVQKRYKLRSD